MPAVPVDIDKGDRSLTGKPEVLLKYLTDLWFL